VGAAGILIPFHNPLLAAEGFLLLEDLYPGRIDAGFCAGGTKGELAAALLDGRPDSRLDPALYAARVEAFIGHLRGDLPSGHPAAAVPVRRYGSSVPEIWHFGTGPRSAQSAARQGTAFGYSIFHELSRDDTSLMERYRDEFQPSAARPEPLTCLAVAGVCAETEARARLLAKNSGYTSYVANVVGTPEQCREQMEELARRYGTGELAFLSLCSSHADQLRSLRLLSEAYALPAENAALRLSA
jgi:alkanesulfonate monooxygenase SsuD/methylene tetrahydromethanopterin reductase-like flavin-dependent oxidoreductase (luciferase family)